MEPTTDLRLFRLRSNGAAIADGYRLYTGKFRRLFRRSWIMAIFYAVAASLLTYACINYLPVIAIGRLTGMGDATVDAHGALPVLLALAAVFFLLTTVGIAAHSFASMNEHRQTDTITPPAHWYGMIDWRIAVRALAAMLLVLLPTVIAGIAAVGMGKLASGYLSQTAILIVYALLGLLALTATVPLNLTVMKYVLTPGSQLLTTLKETYGTGIRHWGGLFVVLLVSAIVCLLLCFATELPAVVLCMANLNSQLGLLQGDAAGMPEYMGWLTIIVFAVAGFIQAYVQLAALFPLYYLYGSVVMQENERQQLNNTIQ